MGFAYDLKLILIVILISLTSICKANDILGCGGFVKSHVALDFSKIEIGLYTKTGGLKEKTECAPNNGYYFLPLYEKGEYILKVHPPAGWSFEPSEVELTIDGVNDQCSTSQDINFSFNGFGIAGKVITAGQQKGPAGIAVQLVDDKGEVRDTVTSVGGDFHFTPIIPGKYTVKASHPRWKLDPAQAVVQVKEGNTALPVGVLAVKGYDVKGSVTAFGSPISGVYVLLYSKGASPKFRVEGCNTAMLQGLPDNKDPPICHTTTDPNGEFTFGLVPAGDYKLMVLPTPPGQVTYIVKPEHVDFTVLHDSLYIKNAFEVTGFTLVSSARSAVGADVSGAQVLLDGRAVTKTDSQGKFTLASLKPGNYNMKLQHETSVFTTQLSVTQSGNIRVVGKAEAKFRVCGSVSPVDGRRVIISQAEGSEVIPATPGADGKWCTFLPIGSYIAKVEVSEQEQRDGLQYYPLSQKVSVKDSAVEGISFSQLKGELSGRVVCSSLLCDDIVVTMRPLSADGGYVGKPVTMKVKDGKYSFKDVLPGSVEVSVDASRLCWREAAHNVVLASQHATVPDIVHTGYLLNFRSSHPITVSYKSAKSSGELEIPVGSHQQCVSDAGRYEFSPLGCHRYRQHSVTADTTAADTRTIEFEAIAHAVVVRVTSPEAVNDLKLRVTTEKGSSDVGPLEPKPMATGGFVFEHTLYMAEGEIATVHASSSTLLTEGGAPVQLVGGSDCQPHAATVRALRALTLRGKLVPAVEGATVTLTSDDLKLVYTTTADGTYKFGPLDASKKYEITAEKESYVFSAPDDNGVITAHKLAEITVELLDEADNSPLQGAPVSVSGGTYRRVLAADDSGKARFTALQPADYYVKPHAKEYKFTPHHQLLKVADGQNQKLTLKGRRVAWSCMGRVVWLGGRGAAGVALAAAPREGSPAQCVLEHCTSDESGNFRIRGLLPGCVYSIELKESSKPEFAGLKLVKAPASLEIKDNKDIEGIRIIAIQPQQLTDVNVLIRAHIDHYKTLRLTLASESNPTTPIFSTKLDSAGYNQFNNPGLLYVLPRLPADNGTYVVQLESTLSKATHVYPEEVHYFVSDGKFKSIDIDFTPKVKLSEQELRQTSLLVVPLLLALALAYTRRSQLASHAIEFAGNLASRRATQPVRRERPDLLDSASIDHIVSTVNAAGKRTAKKKQ